MTEKPEDIISDEEIERVHGSAGFGGLGFGSLSKRQVVDQGLLKCACGFYQGRTSKKIITKHGLIDSNYMLTEKGRTYLWAAFRLEVSV